MGISRTRRDSVAQPRLAYSRKKFEALILDAQMECQTNKGAKVGKGSEVAFEITLKEVKLHSK